MFTKSAIRELQTTHESLDILLLHVGSIPASLPRQPLAGFGFPTVWKQLIHLLTVEEGWIHDLQDKAFAGWGEEDCAAMTALLAAKSRLRDGTRAYIDSLSEAELNTTFVKRPPGWLGELRVRRRIQRFERKRPVRDSTERVKKLERERAF